MATQVRTCFKCRQLMWLKEEDIEYLDERTLRMKCPHCHETVRVDLVVEGSTATGPKMGH